MPYKPGKWHKNQTPDANFPTILCFLLLFCFLVFSFWVRDLYIPGWPETHYAAENDLDPPASFTHTHVHAWMHACAHSLAHTLTHACTSISPAFHYLKQQQWLLRLFRLGDMLWIKTFNSLDNKCRLLENFSKLELRDRAHKKESNMGVWMFVGKLPPRRCC